MTKRGKGVVPEDPWANLRRLTFARIALGRAGVSQPTAPHLAFQHAHALARDAVHTALDTERLTAALEALGLEVVSAASAAPDRPTYLKRPDLGRRLSPASRERLVSAAGEAPDIVLVVADEIGEVLGASLAVLLVGERPGLSSPDSLGVYLTYAPRRGRRDAERNCISNIRPEGLGYEAAAYKLDYLIREALRRQLSGVGLKDEAAPVLESDAGGLRRGNFLLGDGG